MLSYFNIRVIMKKLLFMLLLIPSFVYSQIEMGMSISELKAKYPNIVKQESEDYVAYFLRDEDIDKLFWFSFDDKGTVNSIAVAPLTMKEALMMEHFFNSKSEYIPYDKDVWIVTNIRKVKMFVGITYDKEHKYFIVYYNRID